MRVSRLPYTLRMLVRLRQEQFRPPDFKPTFDKALVFDEMDVIDSFVWDRTPEGYEFWAQVHDATKPQHLPKLPEHCNLIAARDYLKIKTII